MDAIVFTFDCHRVIRHHALMPSEIARLPIEGILFAAGRDWRAGHVRDVFPDSGLGTAIPPGFRIAR